MEARVLSKISVRILAIYLMATGFMEIPNIVTIISNTGALDNDSNIILLTFISISLTPIMVGLILWFASEKLSKLISGIDSNIEVNLLNNPQLQTIIISTIGLTIAVLTIPELIRYIYQVFTITDIIGNQKVYDAYNIAYLLGAILKFILGISLAFGVRFWLRLLHYFRELGLSAKTTNK